MAYTIIIPALKRMDHCKPVIEYVRESVKEDNPEIHVVFVPLMESIRENLVKFIWGQIRPRLTHGKLHRIRLHETPTIFTDYYG